MASGTTNASVVGPAAGAADRTHWGSRRSPAFAQVVGSALGGVLACVVALAITSAPVALANAATTFDHGYSNWDAMLRTHVRWDAKGVASTLDYKAIAADHAALERSLEAFSAVSRAEFDGWSRSQRLAFLVNAYNAFTIELVLGRYPDLRSIRELGSIFQSPWKKVFFRLLGERRHLDNVEHDMIRAPGAFDDPRIHFVVVCASLGCPALRPEAFVAERLGAQFDDSMRRFLGDRSRNRYDPKTGKLEVSRIFDWYREDFEKDHLGIRSREGLFARYAEQLADDPADRKRVREGKAPLAFLDYDWALNDRRSGAPSTSDPTR